MKLELDIDDLESLRTKAKELERALATVRHAINQHDGEESVANSTGEDAPDGIAGALVATIIASLPNSFTSSDVITQAEANRPDISRGAVRNVIQAFVDGKRIAVAEMGKGRRPTKYKKLT